MRGGSIVNWPLHRKALSVGGNLYVKVLLGMPVNDATAGYRVYRGRARCARWGSTTSRRQGYCFQTDLTWRAVKHDLTVVEVPITFVEREVGDSKMSRDIMTESLRRITALGRAPPRPPGARAGRRRARAEVARAVSRTGATPYASRGGVRGCCAGCSSPC